MATRITAFDRQGNPLADLTGIEVTYAETINTASKGLLSVGVTDPRLTTTNFAIRNFILIEDTYIEPWVGVVSGNTQEWFFDHVEFGVWDASYLMKYRRASVVQLDGSGGDIFGELIDLANAPEALNITKDQIWAGGPQTSLLLKYDNLYDALVRFANRTGGEFRFVPQVSGGNLTVLAQWFQQVGRVRDFTLNYPGDFQEPGGSIMTVGTDPINNTLVFGGGASNVATPVSSPDSGTEDAASRSQYGLIQGVAGNNMVVQASLDAQAQTLLDVSKNPRRTFRINGLENTTKKTFENCGLGDIINVSFAGVGFNNNGGLGTETTVRIVAWEYNPGRGVLSLTVDEFI